VAAVAAGNALEFYDFLTFSFFAPQIGQAFFPSSDPAASLLATLATFGIGFLPRPVGAFVIGRLGDRVGRKPAMLLSFALMGLSIVGLALTPGFAQIGVAAPVLAVLFRLVQGFALGGEVGPSTAYLVEAAPVARRGLYASFQGMSQQAAVISAGVVGVILSSVLGPETFRDWGWRIAFLLGAAIVPFGLMLRSSLVETLKHEEPSAAPTSAPLRVAMLGLVVLSASTIVTYVLQFLSTYATTTLHMPVRLGFWSTIVLGVSGFVFAPIGGALSDRIGRRATMIPAMAALLVMVIPCFALIGRERSVATLLGVTAVMASVSALGFGAVFATISEGLPKAVRSLSFALVYALAIAVFGGSAQFNVKALSMATHSDMAPAWYMAVATAIGLLGMFAMRETAPVKQARG
jgi:MFS family permease